ncbi:MAG: hypothetical protein ACI9R3_000913 [Verrucomicrobiales bacterium]|jgi:hypothetical protein
MKVQISFLIVFGLISSARADDKPSAGPQPATVENARSESDLTTITLTPLAEKRIGIELKPVEKKTISRTRVFGGEVILPLIGAAGGDDSIYSLFPNMTPAEMVAVAGLQVDADAQINKAALDLEASQISFKRTEELLNDKAGTQKDVDDARAIFQLAEAAVTAAKAKRDLLGKPVLQSVKQSVVWVRVPVYVGDLKRIKKDADAAIGDLADRPGAPKFNATRVKVPMSSGSAGVTTATVDLYFALQVSADTFQLGQRVGVTLPLAESGESLTVPWSAVVTDINGGNWVYKNIAPQKYQRHRVQIRYVVGEDAAIATGPAEGTKVAVNGVTELFGTEFGTGK